MNKTQPYDTVAYRVASVVVLRVAFVVAYGVAFRVELRGMCMVLFRVVPVSSCRKVASYSSSYLVQCGVYGRVHKKVQIAKRTCLNFDSNVPYPALPYPTILSLSKLSIEVAASN